MNIIISSIFAETAENLQVDRAFILKLKYHYPFGDQNFSQEKPLATVEVILGWEKNQELKQDLISYELSNSPLTIYAWQKAPDLVNISSQRELKLLNLTQDIEDIFPISKIKSLLILPLFSDNINNLDKPIPRGFLVLEKEQFIKWKLSAIETSKWMALIASLSIINQQTVEKLQSEIDQHTAQLSAALRLKELLSNVMLNHLEKLKRLNQIKDEFIANLSDALKNPLNNMNMSITMLKCFLDRDDYINSEKGWLYLNILKSECDKEINLINNLLTLQDIRTGNLKITIEQLLLAPILIEFEQNFNQEWKHKQLIVRVNCELDFIYLDLENFKLILKELLHNAGKFSINNTEVTLFIYQQINHTILKVTNIGDEIPEKKQEKIFQPFYQQESLSQISNSGTGLGLALVKSLVEYFNGTITVSSIPLPNNPNYYFNTFTINFSQLIA